MDGPPAAAAPHAAAPTGNLSSTYLLAGTELSDEQKLQVALCRRQCWLRAFQAGPTAALCSYAAVVLAEATRAAPWVPRGSRTAAPLAGLLGGLTVGAYLGGKEARPMMEAALRGGTQAPMLNSLQRRDHANALLLRPPATKSLLDPRC